MLGQKILNLNFFSLVINQHLPKINLIFNFT